MPKPYPETVVQAARALTENGLQQWKVAQQLGISRGVVTKWARKYGWTTCRTGPRSGPGHPCWKGGRKLVGRYWYIYSPDHPLATKQHYVAEHRLVMETKLGRYLKRSEVVHHRDGNPQNNDPANLEVFQTNSEHLKHELTGRVPNWSPEGQARIKAGVRKAAAIHRRIKSDDDRRILSTAHPPSSADSSDANRASETAQKHEP